MSMLYFISLFTYFTDSEAEKAKTGMPVVILWSCGSSECIVRPACSE